MCGINKIGVVSNLVGRKPLQETIVGAGVLRSVSVCMSSFVTLYLQNCIYMIRKQLRANNDMIVLHELHSRFAKNFNQMNT